MRPRERSESRRWRLLSRDRNGRQHGGYGDDLRIASGTGTGTHTGTGTRTATREAPAQMGTPTNCSPSPRLAGREGGGEGSPASGSPGGSHLVALGWADG